MPRPSYAVQDKNQEIQRLQEKLSEIQERHHSSERRLQEKLDQQVDC